MHNYNYLFVIRRFTIGGSQINLLAIIKELDKRGFQVHLLSDYGMLVKELPKNVKWHHYPFTTKFHPNVAFYKKLFKVKLKYDINRLIAIDPILSIESFLAYHIINIQVYGFITAQNIPCCYIKNFPTIFVNLERKNYYSDIFGVNNSYYIKERLDVDNYKINRIPLVNEDISLGIISRLDFIKKDSIQYVLDLFIFLNKNSKNRNYTFYVIGGGELLPELKDKYEFFDINFKGEVLDVPNELKRLDVVFGMASTIQQAMISGAISVVVGDKGIQGIVSENNIGVFSEKHFNVHSIDGISNEDFNIELEYYINNIGDLSFYQKYIEDNYSVEVGVNKLNELMSLDYQSDNILFTFFIILKVKILSLINRFNKKS